MERLTISHPNGKKEDCGITTLKSARSFVSDLRLSGTKLKTAVLTNEETGHRHYLSIT